jgi:hypothetical protein
VDKYRKIPPAAAANQIAENARIPPAADLQKINICYLPAARSVLKKYFPEVSETAPGRRPRDASEAEGKYFLVRTDQNGK